MRINQFVAASTGMSRRAADSVIADGRITVDGVPATTGQSVTTGAVVELDHQPLALPETHTYLMLNKPAGYVTSRARQGSDPTLYELLPPKYHQLRTVGRLDRDSSGLILLTDDGEFIQQHTHPSFEKHKIYELTLSRPLSESDQRKLEAGVKLTDGLSRVSVQVVSGKNVRVVLGEGRNRQLRRTFGALGYTVVRLHRTQMGEFKLEDLDSAAWKIVGKA